MSKEILIRRAEDEFKAFIIAQVMENYGAEVFSITYVDEYKIWAKVEDAAYINIIDDEIEAELNTVK